MSRAKRRRKAEASRLPVLFELPFLEDPISKEALSALAGGFMVRSFAKKFEKIILKGTGAPERRFPPIIRPQPQGVEAFLPRKTKPAG